MSIEKPLREMVQAELRGRLAPMHKAITRMDERLGVIEDLVDIIHRLKPLTTRMQSLQMALPGIVAPPPPPAVRRPTDPLAVIAAKEREAEEARAPRGRAGRPPGRAVVERAVEEGRRCAVIGCRRPARSKGYCSAHYQKLRLLVKTDRRPASWVDDAAPQSVAELVLPRGRAAAKGREEAVTDVPQRPAPPVPPTPKAWVRKKGDKERGTLLT